MRNIIKKVTAIILSFILCFQCSIMQSLAAVDTNAPEIDESTLRVDKTDVTVGDVVKISIKITDETGIKNAAIYYRMPISNQTKSIDLNYNSETDRYEGSYEVNDKSESGQWYINYIYVSDSNGYWKNIYNTDTGWNNGKDLSKGNFIISGTVIDTNAPEVDETTLEVDNKNVTVGDTVKVSVRITDETGIKNAAIYYRMPISNETKSIDLNYNYETDRYEGSYKVTEKSESGQWYINCIYVSDSNGYWKNIYNTDTGWNNGKDLSKGNFIISGTVVDTNAPEVDETTLEVDNKNVTVGDTVKVSVRITDETGIKNAAIYYRMPISNETKSIDLNYNYETDRYEGSYKVTEKSESGQWYINCIYVSDSNGYWKNIYNTDTGWNNGKDLSNGDFNVYDDERYMGISPLENVTYYKKNATVSDKTIQGDVYIGPEAVVTFNNVTVNGNIYVLGTLKGNSIKAKAIKGRYMYYGYVSTYYNGTIVLSGSNSINSISCTTYPVTDIPVRIDNNPINVVDGYLNIKGVIPDVVDLYINDTKIDTSTQGKFIIDDLYVGNADKITLSFRTVFGNTIEKTFDVEQCTKLSDGSINSIPKIQVEDLIFKVGDEINPLEYVKATDKEDGDITSKIEVIEDTVDTTKVGEYKVVYKVTDSQGTSATKIIKITVRSNDKPIISASDVTIKIGDKFDPQKDVTASDKEDGDITSKVSVKENTVDPSKIGIYKVVYEVTDSDGNAITKEIKVTVKSNDKPIISASDVELKVGDKFDPLKNVAASDKEDGDITSKIKIIENTVDTTKAGIYKVVYEVTDSDGNKITKEIKVTVRSNDKPVIIASDAELKVGDKFDALKKVSSSDKEDGDTTSKIKVIENTVDTTKVGIYKVVYEVTDGDGNKVRKEIKVTVSKIEVVSNVEAKSKSYSSNNITWSKVDNVDGYEIYRATSKNGAYSLNKTVTSGSTLSYSNTGLTTGKTYYYKVRAYKVVDGEKQYGDFSQVVSSSPKLSSTTAKSASVAYNSNKVTWSKVSGASGYEVYRATSKTGTYSLNKTVTSGSTLSYSNTGLTTGKTYYYKVRAYKVVDGKKQYGNFSQVVSSSPKIFTPSVTLSKGSKKATVRWKKISGASGYEIYRSNSKSGTYSKVKSVSRGSTTSYTNRGLTSKKVYYYKIRAYRTVNGKKVYSSYSSIKYIKAK